MGKLTCRISTFSTKLLFICGKVDTSVWKLTSSDKLGCEYWIRKKICFPCGCAQNWEATAIARSLGSRWASQGNNPLPALAASPCTWYQCNLSTFLGLSTDWSAAVSRDIQRGSSDLAELYHRYCCSFCGHTQAHISCPSAACQAWEIQSCDKDALCQPSVTLRKCGKPYLQRQIKV